MTEAPEFNVVLFALLLNFAREILQAPLYAGMADTSHAPKAPVRLWGFCREDGR